MKVMISMPEELLAAVDAEAERRDQSRSALIRAALREHLVTRALDDREAALQSLRRAFAGGDWGDQRPSVRAEREREAAPAGGAPRHVVLLRFFRRPRRH